jgi:hypothetical protein
LTILFVTLITFANAQENEKIGDDISANLLTLGPVTYRLFPTQNFWTFIKLNTRNGQLWQVQFDLDGINRFSSDLSTKSLVTQDQEINDRFCLYPTQNFYTFLLLDQLDGRTWQVQWSKKPENRYVVPIK